jgi:SAM-dependent methyltransferase
MSAPCPVCDSHMTSPAFEARDLALGSASGTFGYWRCHACGSIFSSPQPDEATLAAAYSDSYGNYRTGPSLVERLATPLALREARRLLRHTDGSGDLIELGAGNGRFLERLKRCGWTGSLEGIEFDEDVAAATSSRTGFLVRQGNVDHEVLPKRAFDMIVMRHVIEHLRRPVATLGMVFQALRPGGLLFVGTPDARALCALVFGRYWWGYEVPRHLVIFSRPALHSALQRVGFTPVDSWSGFSPHMWSASLGLLLAERHPRRWHPAASSPLNPITMSAFGTASTIEVAIGRSTMLSMIVRRPV